MDIIVQHSLANTSGQKRVRNPDYFEHSGNSPQICPFLSRYSTRGISYSPPMATALHRTDNSRNVITVTRKFCERVAHEGLRVNHEQAARLLNAPSTQRLVSIDISDTEMRTFLSSAIQPFMYRGEAAPPALVGSARRVNIAITEYERRTSNLDLFED